MLPKLIIPDPQPPHALPGYDLPTTHEKLLTWEFVAEQMTAAHYYWISTTYPDGRPHAVPVWGIWHNNRLQFDGGPQTRWSRNLASNPAIAVHLPDGNQVVIIEGHAEALDDNALDKAGWAQIDTLYGDKYDAEGSPYWVVHPHKVLAWDGDSLETMTRWVFK